MHPFTSYIILDNSICNSHWNLVFYDVIVTTQSDYEYFPPPPLDTTVVKIIPHF